MRTPQCFTHICRKRFDFFADCRSPLNIANLPVKSPFSRKHFCNFVPIFDRPPSCPCIPIKHVTDLKISKSYIGNVPRILLSKKYFIKESSFAFYFLSFSLLYYKEISLVLALFFWLKKKKLHELIYKSRNFYHGFHVFIYYWVDQFQFQFFTLNLKNSDKTKKSHVQGRAREISIGPATQHSSSPSQVLIGKYVCVYVYTYICVYK